jgi:hypothetical protein
MSRETIKDKNYRIVGYIDTMSDGKVHALWRRADQFGRDKEPSRK